MQVKCDLCVRTSTYTVQSCWEILLFASAPSCLVHCCFFSSARCIYSGSMIDSMEAKQRILLKFACRQKSNQKRLLCVFLCCARQQIISILVMFELASSGSQTHILCLHVSSYANVRNWLRPKTMGDVRGRCIRFIIIERADCPLGDTEHTKNCKQIWDDVTW